MGSLLGLVPPLVKPRRAANYLAMCPRVGRDQAVVRLSAARTKDRVLQNVCPMNPVSGN